MGYEAFVSKTVANPADCGGANFEAMPSFQPRTPSLGSTRENATEANFDCKVKIEPADGYESELPRAQPARRPRPFPSTIGDWPARLRPRRKRT